MREILSVLGEIKAAMDREMMLDALRLAEETGVPLAQWPQGEARRLAARLAGNLGDPRLADVLHCLNWRGDRQNPEYYFQALFARFRWTPAAYLREEISERLKGTMADSTRADLLAFQAWAFSMARDFEPAHALIGEALKLSPQDSWLHVQHASILEAHDRYDEALEQGRRAMELRPDYRQAVLQSCESLVHLGRDNEALELLAAAHARTQQAAFSHRMLLFYSEREDHANALHCLDNAERLQPLATAKLKKWMAGRRADLLYLAGDIDGSLEWCDRKDEGFHKVVAENLRKPGAREKRRVRLRVPFVRQHRMTCAPATLAALAAFWDKQHGHLEIAAAICHEGTPWHKERNWASGQGFVVREFKLTPTVLRELIDRGVPFTLTTQWTTGAHLQACIGYDERNGVVLIRDPTERHYVEMILEKLIEQHPVDGPRCMLLLPPEEAGRLDGLTLPHEAAYDAHHELLVALDGHDRWKVEAGLAMLRAVAPGSMLALQGEARVAAYLRDHSRELTAVDFILERAPDHGYMLQRKSYLLSHLGRRKERRELLAKAAEGHGGGDPVFISELGELILQDARELPMAEHHLRRALRHSPTLGRCHESLARCRDTQQRHEESLFLRRCAATLTPDSEGYARAYFDTCRILKRSGEGIAFLRARARQHGHKQAGPWMTLAGALDTMHSNREAVAVLEEARAALPDNGELLLEAGALMAGWGGELRERGMRWVEAARGKAPESDWLRNSARLAGFLGDRPLAILRWRTLLAGEPLAIDAWRALTRLVAEEEGEQVALELLKEGLAKHPTQTGLWALLADMRTRHPDEAIAALDRILQLDPHDRWAWRERALRRLDKGEKEEALADAREALALDPQEAVSHGILASILERSGKREEARSEYETAVRGDIDYIFAARGLVGLATDREESLRAVRFIESEMRRQVSSGEVVPVYQELAWRFVDPPVLLGHLQEFCSERPDLWQTWMARVRQALQMRLDIEALTAATTLTDSFPLLPRSWMVLAEVHRASGRMEDEERALAQAVDIAPGWDEVGRDHADVLERMGRLTEAEAVLRRALLLEPLVAPNYGVLADFLNRTGRRREAAELLRKAVEIAPFYSWGWETRARWAREDGQIDEVARELSRGGERHGHRSGWWSMSAEVWEILGMSEESLAAVERGLASDPAEPTVRDQLAHRHATAGRFEEALAACGPVAGEERAPVPLEGRRAWLLMQFGQSVKAIEAMQALLEREPNYTWGMSELAGWLSQRQDWQKLRDLAKNWSRLEPAELRAWGYLGQAERALGNTEAAKEAYRRAHSMHPDYVYAGRQLADIQMELRDFDGAEATLRLLQHYAPSPFITVGSIELSIRRGKLQAALAEAEKLPGDPEAGTSIFHSCSGIFRKHGHAREWQKWLTSKVEPGTVAAPGAVVAYLSELPEKRQLKEAVRWITREAEGSPARIAAWTWALDKAGRPGSEDTLRRWAVVHRKELHANPELWNAMGSAMAEVGLGDLGIEWFSGWKQRIQDMNAAGFVDLALMYEQVKRDPERNWHLAAEARGEMLARFPTHHVGPMARASLAFHRAVEGRLDQAADLLADFEPQLTSDYYQQMARFAEAILHSAAGRNSEAEEKARLVLGYIAKYPGDASLQRHRTRGERALVSHQPWAKGSVRRLRKKWRLPASPKQGFLAVSGSEASRWLWALLILFYLATKACNY